MQCPASGGIASPVTTPPSSAGIVIDLFPSFLPDGQHFLFTRIFRSAPESSGVFVGALGDAPTQKSARLLITGFGASYVDGARSDVGRILVVRDGTLFAQPFNARTRELSGDQVRVASPVGSYNDYAFVSASASGTLVFRAPDPEVQLTWFDRRGAGWPGSVNQAATRVSHCRRTASERLPCDRPQERRRAGGLAVRSLSNTPRQLTFDPLLERSPIWMDAGGRILFTLGGVSSGV